MGAEGPEGRQERALPGRTQPSQVQEALLMPACLSFHPLYPQAQSVFEEYRALRPSQKTVWRLQGLAEERMRVKSEAPEANQTCLLAV